MLKWYIPKKHWAASEIHHVTNQMTTAVITSSIATWILQTGKRHTYCRERDLLECHCRDKRFPQERPGTIKWDSLARTKDFTLTKITTFERDPRAKGALLPICNTNFPFTCWNKISVYIFIVVTRPNFLLVTLTRETELSWINWMHNFFIVHFIILFRDKIMVSFLKKIIISIKSWY
jgi:hypothetical protein